MLHPAVALFQLSLIALVGRTFASLFPSMDLGERSSAVFSRPAQAFLRLTSCFTLGSAVLTLAFLLMGFVRFDMLTLTGIASVLALPGLSKAVRGLNPKDPELPPRPPSPRTWPGFLNALLIATVALTAGLALWGCFAPEVRSDAVVYHLRIPRLWLNFGRIVDIPEQGLSYYPYGFEMLYAWSMSLGSDSSAKVMHWAAGVSAAGWCARLASKSGLRGMDCVAIFYLLPMIQSLSTTSYVDLAMAMYALAALTLFLESLGKDESDRDGKGESRGDDKAKGARHGLLFGLLAGSAIATKYPAWPILGVVFGAIALYRYRAEPKTLLIFAGFASLPALPWILRNVLYTGNPVAPLLIERFGPESAIGSELSNLMSFHAGRGRDWSAILLAPAGLFRHLAFENYPIGLLGPPAALAMIFLSRSPGRSNRSGTPLKWIPFFVLALFLTEAYSTFGHPSGRYGLTTMALGAICFVALTKRFSETVRDRRLYGLVYILIGLSFLNVLHARNLDRIDLGESFAPIWSPDDRMAYLEKRGIVPPFFTEIELHLDLEECDRVLGWGYPSTHRSWISYLALRNELVYGAGGENAPAPRILESLRAAGVTHMVGDANPGFSNKTWHTFISERTEKSGPAEWRLRRVRTGGRATGGMASAEPGEVDP